MVLKNLSWLGRPGRVAALLSCILLGVLACARPMFAGVNVSSIVSPNGQVMMLAFLAMGFVLGRLVVHGYRNQLNAPRPSAQDAHRLAIEKRVREDLESLRERARRRNYPETMSVLTFYWLQTVREAYTLEHWPILQEEIRKVVHSRGYVSSNEVLALEQASEWIAGTLPSKRTRIRRENMAPPFSSERLAPPDFVSQEFLENLLNRWLPERVLERYGTRLIAGDWSSENAYQEIALCLEDLLRRFAVFPDTELVQAFDEIQNRPPAPAEDVAHWRQRRQAGLESLVRVPLRDASAVDPKIREILNDVVLYLLGLPSPPPSTSEAGYACLFPMPFGADLPADLPEQVCQYPLPLSYRRASTLFIPLKRWAGPPPDDSNGALSIRSTLLTPDGRVWEAHHMEQEAGSPPGITYRPIGRLDTIPTTRGRFLRVPMASWPEEISPEVSRAIDLVLFHRRWHMKCLEGASEGSFIIYEPVLQTAPAGADTRKMQNRDDRWQMRKAS